MVDFIITKCAGKLTPIESVLVLSFNINQINKNRIGLLTEECLQRTSKFELRNRFSIKLRSLDSKPA